MKEKPFHANNRHNKPGFSLLISDIVAVLQDRGESFKIIKGQFTFVMKTKTLKCTCTYNRDSN